MARGDVTALTAYPLNGPSKLVTPDLEFPVRAGLPEVRDTTCGGLRLPGRTDGTLIAQVRKS